VDLQRQGLQRDAQPLLIFSTLAATNPANTHLHRQLEVLVCLLHCGIRSAVTDVVRACQSSSSPPRSLAAMATQAVTF